RLQAKQGAAVINQIEFHVASPAYFLKVPLLIGVRFILSAFYNRYVSFHKGVGCICCKMVPVFGGLFFIRTKVIKKEAADTARLAAVGIIKIVITLFLKARV